MHSALGNVSNANYGGRWMLFMFTNNLQPVNVSFPILACFVCKATASRKCKQQIYRIITLLPEDQLPLQLLQWFRDYNQAISIQIFPGTYRKKPMGEGFQKREEQ